MTRTRKVFEATTADTDDPIPFEVILTNGENETRRMEFAAYGAAPGDAVMVLTAMARVTNKGEATIDGSGMAEFMDYALMDDGPQRWRDMIADHDWKIRAEIIGDVVGYIQEEWAGRPTQQSSRSSASPPSPGANSTALASSTA